MSLIIRFILCLSLLLFGAYAHTCPDFNAYGHQARFSSFHNYEALIGKAPAPGKRNTAALVKAVEIEECNDLVPSRKELKNGNFGFTFYYALAHTYLYRSLKTGTAFCEDFSCISSPAFIINCVIRI